MAATADFNLGGHPDIAWQNLATGKRVIWFTIGMSIRSTQRTTLVEPAWRIVGAADFNGDGKSDLLWRTTAAAARSGQ